MIDIRGSGWVVAAGVQVGLVGVLWLTVGVGAVGAAAATVFTAGLLALLAGALCRAGRSELGPADVVTLGRALLVGIATAIVADGFVGRPIPVATLVGVVLLALALDGVDGKVARATGTATPLGARFDMEVDAALVMVLSVQAATLVGPWALAIGLMRYAWVALTWTAPWLRGTLPPSMFAKTVAVLQGVTLVVVSAGVLPATAAVTLVAVALGLLTMSFGRSALALHRLRAVAPQQEIVVPLQRAATRERQTVGPPAA